MKRCNCATPWCNGSTSGFGPFRLGSSPGGVAIFVSATLTDNEVYVHKKTLQRGFV